jgi:hypothetical protein
MGGSSLIRLEEVAQAAPESRFQAYLPGDPERVPGLIDRAAAAGFGTLVVTVDGCAGGSGPRGQHPRRLLDPAAAEPAAALGRRDPAALGCSASPAARCRRGCSVRWRRFPDGRSITDRPVRRLSCAPDAAAA